MRIGLVGNGYWAGVTHAAGLQAEQSVQLAGVWGRDLGKSQALAADLDITAYDDVDEMFADVDAVAFSVPPQVQSELAVRAARLGKHLLLEKPIAVTPAAAAELAAAVDTAGVASVVFFTGRYDAAQRAWVEQTARRTDWDAAAGLWLGSAFASDSPFDTPWRHEKGGLWDVGPHALAMLSGVLGPIERITARAGRRDLVHLVTGHASGASATYSVSIDAPEAAAVTSLTVWGPAGRTELPAGPADPSAALATAARELAAAARQQHPSHPLDVHFGRHVVDLLADAQSQLAAG